MIDGLQEDEVLIRCGRVDDAVQKLQAYIQSISDPKLTFFKDSREYYLPLEDILFFETEGDRLYAHTADNAYRVKFRLYELEEMLPRSFIRASKGTIVNIQTVYAINRNLTSSSQIRFKGTHKQIYVSRYYYKTFKEKLDERSL